VNRSALHFDLFIAFQLLKPDGLDLSITLSSGNVLFRFMQLGCTVMAGDRRLSSNRSSRKRNLSCDQLSGRRAWWASRIKQTFLPDLKPLSYTALWMANVRENYGSVRLKPYRDEIPVVPAEPNC
jgi:hypothetical protein